MNGQVVRKLRNPSAPAAIAALVLLFTLPAHGAAAQTRPERGSAADAHDQAAADQQQLASLARLRATSRLNPAIRLERGAVRSAMLRVAVPESAGRDPVARAEWFLSEHRGLLRLNDPSRELQLKRRSRDGQSLFFRQVHQGIPVFPAHLSVHLSGADVVAVNGRYVPPMAIARSPEPGLAQEQAEALALASAGANARIVGDTQLRYLNLGLLGFADQNTHLAWLVNLTGVAGQPGMFIDADTGALLYTSWRDSSAFELEYLETALNGTSDSCYIFADNTAWFDENGPLPGASPDAEGFQAFDSITAVYNFWKGLPFERDSYDGQGEEIEMYIHVGQSWFNASYTSGPCDIFQFSDGWTVRDLVGHEFTHAVDDAEEDLEYINGSGALDESFADIFGHFVDPTDWQIGEQLPASSVANPGIRCPSLPAGTLRDMSNPPSCGDPDHMEPTLSGDGMGFRLTTGVDFGYVHTNSGIHNKVAFLITAGGTHNGRTIVGLGNDKAKRLFYSVLTGWVGTASQFIDARDGAVLKAIEFSLSQDFSSSDVCQVRNAYASVGLGQGDMDCDGKEDNTDTDGDGDLVSNAADNCPLIPNPGQVNNDSDAFGDACDPDADGDGDLNAADNCPFTSNDNQADFDGDGKGDVCDNSDGDSKMDAIDNCPAVANSNQTNSDGDKQGDACDDDDDNDGDSDGADNCPAAPNAGQEDSDSDGIGDACDLCPGFPSGDNNDNDDDELGDPCDPDDDNDLVPDVSDNCPKDDNFNQIDFDKDGVGRACDADERASWDLLTSAVLEVDLPFSIPLPAPDCIQCDGRYLPAGFEQVIGISLPVGYRARVLDSQGRNMGKITRGFKDGTLTFAPAPYTLQGAGTLSTTGQGLEVGRTALGGSARTSQPLPAGQTRYYLEIYPGRGAEARGPHTLKFNFRAAIGEGAE